MANISSFFSNNLPRKRNRYHTPTTYRATKRLVFPTPVSPGISGLRQIQTDVAPPGVSPPNSPRRTTSASAQSPILGPAPTNFGTISIPPNNAPSMMLPWEILGSKATDLYKQRPPAIKYPAGSQDQAVNACVILMHVCHDHDVTDSTHIHACMNHV